VQGYERAVARVPDMVLLDVRMPKMDGFALCRQLKANSRTAHVPIIFLSSAGDLTERLTGLREGGVDYILKPFSADEVLARVRIHLLLARNKRLDQESGAGQGVEPSDDQVLIRAAKTYLSARLADAPTLRHLALFVGVSASRLTRAFRSEDLTVFGFLRQERMRVAKRLLVQSSLNIATISEEIGFSSAANFSTAFLEYVGMSPSAFRAQAVLEPEDLVEHFPRGESQANCLAG
jgi:YesN/AraC family two-component response regulator